MIGPDAAPDSTFQHWMQERLDRMDDKITSAVDRLAQEMQTTRHSQRANIEQMAIQSAQLVTMVADNTRRIEAINLWRAEDGPLDNRFEELEQSQNHGDAWRNRMVGGLATIVFLFPLTVGVVLAVATHSFP